MKYKIHATIPTVQYGNIRPVFEVEDNEEEALTKLESLWSMFGEQPLKKRTDLGEQLTTFTGETVFYNDDTHKYYDTEGNELLSGSQYASQFAKPFDEQAVSKAVADKTGESQEAVLKKWSLGGGIANNYGTAVHDSVEFVLLGGDIEKIPQVLRPQVQELVDAVNKLDMTPHMEVVISDVKNKAVGRVDCLLIDPVVNTDFMIVDYKTNRELKKDKVNVYTKQLEYYRDIMVNHGYNCKGLVIMHHDGQEFSEIRIEHDETTN